VARPSIAEYWHIGETVMRLTSVTPPNVNGENRALAMIHACLPNLAAAHASTTLSFLAATP
jgi:hypothetical protein